MPGLAAKEPGPRDMPTSALSYLSPPCPPQPGKAYASPSTCSPHIWRGQGNGRAVRTREGRTKIFTQQSKGEAPGPTSPTRGLTWLVAAVVSVAMFWPLCFLWLRCSGASWTNPRLSVGGPAWSSGGQTPPQGWPPRSGLRGSRSGTRRAGAGCRSPCSGTAAGTRLGRQGEG